jgi:hypothetical protein
MQYGGDLSYLGHTRIGMPYIYETNLISDPPEKKIDPKTNREKYICGVDPFEVEPTPTPDLIMKKEKKFSL